MLWMLYQNEMRILISKGKKNMSKGKISRGKGVKKNYWVAEDIALVKRGIVPEGRTYIQAASYAHKHGIPWKELRRKVCAWWWRPEEEDKLRNGLVPPNRSWQAIRQRKNKLGIPSSAAPTREDFVDAHTTLKDRGL